MRTSWTIVFLTAVFGSTPVLADGMQWQLRQSRESTVLAYEVPDTDDQGLVFSCEAAARTFSISYAHDRDQVRAGSDTHVEFASEGGRVTFNMKAVESELGGLFLEATAPFTPEMNAVLAKGRTLKIRIDDQTETIKLVGTAKGAAALAKMCRY